ncbi:putative DNA endonuclease SmrA [wastewater metagenome]|uniref:Putative DNA endonuclease SmrA n=2 Tax=unclassified sequences TaxID=12908 RepID=A0A5B8RDG4_9ZZZZ|nr:MULTISPECIES: Smr/MutS family protein [Arhodomonas]MCS4503221.1 Smr/MutS family protein [Arhodomonas aquaeolei]QEA04757.1 putative DNA endonuclease SmrA [uncultured organism]
MSEHDRDSDPTLFREAMRDVRPLKDDGRHDAAAPRPRPVPRQRLADNSRVMAELLRPPQDDTDLGPERGEALSYLRDDIDRRVLRRLRRGRFVIQAELDLHGMVAADAVGALRDFLQECRERDVRCVRIIHGKGRRSGNDGPVLKGKVDRWLRQRDDVLAFCSARRVDGGTGAVYALLGD